MNTNKTIEALPVQYKANPDYWESVKLGVQAGILWAPTTLFNATKDSIALAASGIAMTLGAFVVWFASRLIILFAGFTGNLRKL